MLSTLLVLFVALQRASATSTCYFPDASIASDFVPCSPLEDGNCCKTGDFCTSMGYCISNDRGYHYRGGCTDNTWVNPSCPIWCLGNTNDGNSTYVDVIACSGATTDGTWCCAYNNTNCCNSDSLYIPAGGNFGTIFAEPTTTTTSSTASSTGLIATKSLDTTTKSSMTSPTSATSSATSQSTSSPTTKDTSKTTTIVGAAVGIPLGLVACAALALYFWERRKRRNVTSKMSDKPQLHVQAAERNELGEHGGHPQKPYELPSQRPHELSEYR